MWKCKYFESFEGLLSFFTSRSYVSFRSPYIHHQLSSLTPEFYLTHIYCLFYFTLKKMDGRCDSRALVTSVPRNCSEFKPGEKLCTPIGYSLRRWHFRNGCGLCRCLGFSAVVLRRFRRPSAEIPSQCILLQDFRRIKAVPSLRFFYGNSKAPPLSASSLSTYYFLPPYFAL